MRRPITLPVVLLSFLAVVVAAACGSTTSSDPGADGGPAEGGGADGPVDAGGNDTGEGDGSAAATPRAIVRANGGAAAGCATVPALIVGDFGDPTTGAPPSPVDNGGQVGGKAVAITCRVAPIAAGGFTLSGSVAISGDTSFTIDATLDPKGKTSAGSFTLTKTSRWTSATCTLDPTSRPEQGVAAGRFWGMLSCGGATSDKGATCDIFGELRLENCAQQ
jgi:hypothetical protein